MYTVRLRKTEISVSVLFNSFLNMTSKFNTHYYSFHYIFSQRHFIKLDTIRFTFYVIKHRHQEIKTTQISSYKVREKCHHWLVFMNVSYIRSVLYLGGSLGKTANAHRRCRARAYTPTSGHERFPHNERTELKVFIRIFFFFYGTITCGRRNLTAVIARRYYNIHTYTYCDPHWRHTRMLSRPLR